MMIKQKTDPSTNPIYSMTAFARVSEQSAIGDISWELRSVNHRYLDVDLRLPNFLSALETSVRELMRKYLKRGHVVGYLKYVSGAEAGLTFQVNEKFLQQYMTALKRVNMAVGKELAAASKPQIDLAKILAYPYALEETESNLELINQAALKLFERALQELLVARAREGAALIHALRALLVKIEAQVAKAKERQPAILAKQRDKLTNKLQEFKESLDPLRLEQEIVLFTQRVDVSEELERLEVHIKELHRVLEQGGAVGKRLDFLIQELNREANTLASKSADVAATYAAVEIKVLLEQIREQVQNLE